MHKAAKRIFKKEDIKVKRIKKNLFSYLRISVKSKLKENIIIDGIIKIAKKLKAIPREQSLKRRPDLEMRSNSQLKNNLQILSLNINGIKSKYYELALMLQRLKPDIICLQETKIKGLKKKTHINGYVIHEVPAGGTSRGLLMGFRNGSNIDFKIIESRYDVILASINDNAIVGNIYRSTNSGTSKLTTQKVVDILKTEKSECLLVGDWNETPSVMERKLSKKGIQVYTTGAPIRGTRIYRNRKRTKRAIDYGLSNCDRLINSQKVRYNWNISDHLPVEVNISLNCFKKSNEKKLIFDRKKLYETNIINVIKSHDYKTSGIDPVMDIKFFHEELNIILKELKVIREIDVNNNIIIPKSIKKAIALKRIKDKEVRKGISPLNELVQMKKNIIKEIRAYKRKSYLRFISRGVEYLNLNDTKNSWKWIKSCSSIGKNKLDEDMVYKPNTLITESDPNRRLEIWAEHFRKLSLADEKTTEIIINSNNKYSEISDARVSWTEIKEVLKSMRKGKASGNDMIPGEVYKLVENENEPTSNLSKSILKILDNIYNGNGFPIEWRDCTVVPIFKKGDKYDPNNYRGIALINTMLKVLTKVIAARLQDICSNHNLIRREQVGFMKSEECVAQVACLLECCQRRKLRGKQTLICFLDLKKAYDMISHDMLILKLKRVRIGNKMIELIKKSMKKHL